MDTTINRRRKKKKSEGDLVSQSEGNTGSNIRKNNSIPLDILHMSDDDPRLLKFMEELEGKRKKLHPNQTHENLKKVTEGKK
jgi:hypothetical protein